MVHQYSRIHVVQFVFPRLRALASRRWPPRLANDSCPFPHFSVGFVSILNALDVFSAVVPQLVTGCRSAVVCFD